MNLKKIVAAGLTVATAFGLVACGGTTTAMGPAGHNEDISMGTWWLQYYDSNSANMEVSPDWVTAQADMASDNADTAEQGKINADVAQRKWDNVKTIEDKYDVKFHWDNLTYTGVQDSINTSILAGSPDCDIYLVDTTMAIPAQMNGLALDLKTVLPADHDIFTTQNVMSYLDLGDGKACLLYNVMAQSLIEGTYPLAFNIQMLEANNLEDPRDLYARGEWTWDKFNEYCKVLTQDTDGDGQTDQYGYCGFVNETFEGLMFSNGASVAASGTEGLSSAETGAVLQEIYDMYNTFNVCYPYDAYLDGGNPSDSMRIQYNQGNIGFFPIAVWIQNANANYNTSIWNTPGEDTDLTWDTAFVRWPVGPNGNQETNAGKNLTSGSYYILPTGVQEPELVFNVLYDWFNWYDGDTSLRDNKKTMNWWYTCNAKTPELQELNVEVMKDCGLHSTMDFWNSLGIEYNLEDLIKGTMTPAQIQETHKQEVQDAVSKIFK